MRKKILEYNLYFEVDGTDDYSITRYNGMKSIVEARKKRDLLNEGLRLSGKLDRRYILAKVTKEFIED